MFIFPQYNEFWTQEMEKEYQKLEARILNYDGKRPRLSVEEMDRYLALDWKRDTYA